MNPASVFIKPATCEQSGSAALTGRQVHVGGWDKTGSLRAALTVADSVQPKVFDVTAAGLSKTAKPAGRRWPA
jgi:hypothetical protein